MAQARYADAASAFATAFRRAPAWRLLARQVQALQLAGEPAEAETGLRDWLVEHPEEAEARILLADQLGVQGRVGEAVREYDEVLESSSVNVIALNNSAWLLRDQDPSRALALAARAVELAPDHPAVLDTWGWLLVASGRAEEALEHLRRAATLAHGTPEIQYHLGYALAKASRAEESRALLEELLRNHAAFPSRGEAEELLATL